jgi:hypothetical protein
MYRVHPGSVRLGAIINFRSFNKEIKHNWHQNRIFCPKIFFPEKNDDYFKAKYQDFLRIFHTQIIKFIKINLLLKKYEIKIPSMTIEDSSSK